MDQNRFGAEKIASLFHPEDNGVWLFEQSSVVGFGRTKCAWSQSPRDQNERRETDSLSIPKEMIKSLGRIVPISLAETAPARQSGFFVETQFRCGGQAEAGLRDF